MFRFPSELALFILSEHPERRDNAASEAFCAGQGTEVLSLTSRVVEVE